MDKKILYIGLALVVIIVLAIVLFNNNGQNPEGQGVFPEGYRDIAYTINGKVVDLQNGEANVEGVQNRIIGSEAEGDITEDGMADIASLLIQEKATSTDYYLVAAIATEGGYRGTGGALLGENLQNVDMQSTQGGVLVRYERPSTATGTSTATSTSTRVLERFFVVINGELESMPVPE